MIIPIVKNKPMPIKYPGSSFEISLDNNTGAEVTCIVTNNCLFPLNVNGQISSPNENLNILVPITPPGSPDFEIPISADMPFVNEINITVYFEQVAKK